MILLNIVHNFTVGQQSFAFWNYNILNIDLYITAHDALWINVCRKIHIHFNEKEQEKLIYYVHVAAVIM